ncbi:hypothetical protein SAMN05216302_10275 [Nitrosomonas aestuarii]|uniref:Uncharacterized protein n=1 Tax=Nitrosomonas aestuarii TaxID=52441 RepID=A0A1I4EAB0_9PROT|nr:hypothetical protein [Nitrosomonas aestuarii]SFL02754.1 hypothetical protein SAMN05216302_10275 [Nitrosomonas aestuarii]
MASGKFFAGTLPNGTPQDTGATPAGKVRTASVNLVNRGSSAASVDVYISTSGTPAEADRIEAVISIPSNGIYKLTGEVVGAGERIVLQSNNSNTIARVSGFEEDA